MWLVWKRSQPGKDMQVEDMFAALQVLETYADLVSMVLFNDVVTNLIASNGRITSNYTCQMVE